MYGSSSTATVLMGSLTIQFAAIVVALRCPPDRHGYIGLTWSTLALMRLHLCRGLRFWVIEMGDTMAYMPMRAALMEWPEKPRKEVSPYLSILKKD